MLLNANRYSEKRKLLQLQTHYYLTSSSQVFMCLELIALLLPIKLNTLLLFPDTLSVRTSVIKRNTLPLPRTEVTIKSKHNRFAAGTHSSSIQLNKGCRAFSIQSWLYPNPGVLKHHEHILYV